MEGEEVKIPIQWYCPITQELMKDPVIADDGFTYQKSGIEQWLNKSQLSPMTGATLSSTKLIPNHALRHTIQNSMVLQQPKPAKVDKEEISADLKSKAQETIKLKLEAYAEKEDEYLVNLQIVPPEQPFQKRKPCCLICILDVSESMNTDAVEGGKDVESHGFSRLDLVKHSMNTMIEFMEDCDELCLIPFSTSAKIALHSTKMNMAGKALARKKLQDMFGEGTTNIWDGLKTALEVAKTLKNESRNVFTILLTDGQPNLNPPRGIVPTLKKFIDIEHLETPNIHVFGYGYELNTNLLTDIAKTGNGSYAYIPDCSMVGTVFVNFMAASLSTLTNKLELTLEFQRELRVIDILGYKPSKDQKYSLGAIQFGQQRNFIMKLHSSSKDKDQPNGLISLRYGNFFLKEAKVVIPIDLSSLTSDTFCKDVLIRAKYIELLHRCLKNGSKREINLKQIDEFYTYLEKEKDAEASEWKEDLLIEIRNNGSENEGQVEKAYLREEWYQKWGQHYIPALYLAHLMQVCTNFKDPGLQKYGGSLFTDFQNKMDTIFIKMAPPKASAKKKKEVVYKPQPVNMRSYYNNCGGCIDGKCELKYYNQLTGRLDTKNMEDVRKGDLIEDGKGNLVRITCMVKTNVFAHVQMVRLGKLLITPWHPVELQNGNWQFPTNIKREESMYIEQFFNFVVEKGHSIEVEGYQCLGLGHGLKGNSVVEHEYFGSQKVLQDMKKSQGWTSGMVEVRETVRDNLTHRVNQMIFA